MPTKLTRRSGTIAVIGAIAWVVAALVSILRAGDISSDSDWEAPYLTWALLVFVAAVCTTVAIFGLLRRTNTGRRWISIAARLLAILGTVLLGLSAWAWIALVPLLTVAALVAVLRLRSQLLGSALFQWLLVIAWPVGIGLALLLYQLKVGPVDSYGDHYLAGEFGFAAGSLLFAAGLATIGLWLRSEKNGES